jgi:hypothetical protein
MDDVEAKDDPVSWLLIRAGWKVVFSDGGQVGRVDEVAGDDTEDIFDGLAVATTALGKPRYVLSEQVAQLTEGTVTLTLTRAQFEQLDEYLEPATSEEVEPESKGGLAETVRADTREIEGKVLAPTQRHEHSTSKTVQELTDRMSQTPPYPPSCVSARVHSSGSRTPPTS